jgi:alpha,alpha-trehalase
MYLSVARRLLAAGLLFAWACYGAEPIQTFQPPRSALAHSPAVPAAQANPHAESSPVETAPPSEMYGELYRAVELAGVFPDSKMFADMIPNVSPKQITADYQKARGQANFDLHSFVAGHFSAPPRDESAYVSDPDQTVVAHVDTLWNVLRRQPDTVVSRWSSLLPLPAPYIVPGGRFDEVYYWDSYFMMLGLEQSGRHDLALDQLNNFATLIDRYGHIPNGNRTYYLSRSQPPFFAEMVALIAEKDGDRVYLRYLPELKAEYQYWMDGADKLKPGHAYRHLVRLPDGTLLNRYWDDRAAPRDESYREDVETAEKVPQHNAADLWRNLRAAGETGWDFSSRWLGDDRTLSSIDVTSLVPVDLNALLYGLERTLAKAYRIKGDAAHAENMETRARGRADAIRRLLWDPRLDAFGDYNFVTRELTHRLTAATVYPLFAGIATRDEARKVAATIKRGLLRPGGMATTQMHSGQQWDEPNGWAPLQFLAVAGLRRYGEDELARTIATRWIRTNIDYYVRTGKLVEKYDVSSNGAKVSATGGEYPLQDGFGWTNGVLRALLARYPNAVDVMTARPAAASSAAAYPVAAPQPDVPPSRQ